MALDILTKIQNSWREGDAVVKPEPSKDDKKGDDTPPADAKPEGEGEETKEEPEHWNLARLEGWMPEEEWKAAGKDPELWKPAKAFLADGEVRRELRKLKRANKRKDRQVDTLVKNQETIYNRAYEQAVADLKAQRDKAAEENDLQGVIKASDDLAELERKKAEVNQQQQPEYEIGDDEKQALFEWGNQNEWYRQSPQLQEYVHNLAAAFMEENEDAMLLDAFEYAGNKARAAFPEQTRAKPSGKPAGSSGVGETPPTRRGGSKTGGRIPQPHELPEDMRDLYKNFQAAGMFKSEQNPKGKLDYDQWIRNSGLVQD